MTFKRVTSAVAGDGSHFGGLDVNKFSDYLGGTDIGASETVDIATLTTFRDSKFTLRNPANTFSYVFVPSAIAASRNITLPLLTGADQITMDAHTTTVTNKTINATNNTITDTSTAAGDILASNGTKFVRKGRGTSLQVLRTNSGGTDIEWAAAAGGEVTLAGAETLTNKTINSTDNTITATSQATGDILANNGTKFVRKARGTALQVLRVNSGATDIEYASLDSERVGKSTAASGASVYNIAHGLGSNPTYAFVDCSSHTTARTFTTDATNIVVTFASTIASGTVTIYWRVVA